MSQATNFLTLFQDKVTVIQTTTGATPASDQHIFGGFNLGTHVNDDPQQVHDNRATLLAEIEKLHPDIERIHWLNQVHGDSVYHVTHALSSEPISADAHITSVANTALAIMTADCVPVMISDENGDVIGAVHAGWQGLAKGVIAKTLQKMAHQISLENQYLAKNQLQAITNNWQAWIGVCIAQAHYEVDEKVKNAVISSMKIEPMLVDILFLPNAEKQGHYFADLAKVAELQLNQCGISQVYQSGLDSYADERFYSYRKQSQQQLPSTGRMAMLIVKQSC